MMNVTVKGLEKLKRDLKAESRRQEKALNTAVKVEGFRLMRPMIWDVLGIMCITGLRTPNFFRLFWFISKSRLSIIQNKLYMIV